MNKSTQIGEAAKALDVTPRYIRKLEAQGLIPRAKRDARGFRVYARSDLDLLKKLGVGSRPRRLRRIEELTR
ncbi:MAG: MerR family DNA-binding transcriptional regulator [Rubrobacter sp.]|nr:MerR family DNA-binding transcriptional regulator [Rubrobacter sp.]